MAEAMLAKVLAQHLREQQALETSVEFFAQGSDGQRQSIAKAWLDYEQAFA